MKIKLNTTTNYNGCTFKLGDEIDLPLNIAQRWINKGIAYPVKEEVKPVEPIIKTVIKAVIPIVKTEVNMLDEPSFKESKTLETKSIFENLPEITEKNIGKLKTSKPKKKK